jgi:hypothetical protein
MDVMFPEDDDVPMLVETDAENEDLELLNANLDDILRIVKVPITIVTGTHPKYRRDSG